LSEWPRRSPATLPFSPRRSPWASCATRSFELSGAAMPSHEGVRPIPARRPCHSSQSARRNAHGHFLAHASRSGWPWQGDGGRQHHIDTDDGPHHEMGSHLIAIPPYVHPPQVLSTTSVCKFFRGHSVGGCPRSCRTFARGRPAAIGRQVRRDSGPPARTCMSNSPSPGRPFGASRLRALTLHAEHGLQHSCLPLCAGSKLNIPPLHPERKSSWILASGALCRPTRPIGPSRCSPSPNVLAPGRTARDTLNGQSRARAPRVRSLSEGAARTRPSCSSFRLSSRALLCCSLCLSCRIGV